MIDFKTRDPRYFDKNGREIHEGDWIKYPDGKIREVYRGETGVLGTDATNPSWIESGRAVPCEFGIYPFTSEETDEVEVI